ncbi:hypothetical protein GLOIN_2v1790361 [Rhizophagus irregularis DAOM 181602=DAOM 197198]|uniref:Uncharacterized protein n=1 Tax=Rhizophagus irregularis (strain DAOM 181602 / DAOM 197198 / MUCL 43194) TaxID=747089 RepID=A0A2P4NZ85_RHIID|nr:hypothetical protein GLOIN_2v1790361 [Rhizophagus irregularis DAOM 181602=DAOM 197198]POG58455.1 hypothetical protein GLOIN_2v1790361 [Rhizophagus irregularis DAOM 181602=DAOM 197198]|eukprot:XP_025165321.1 hypothetical protein GLOIN_2v1790361 [Rhizophagus irregularis DAOM 181602=DAOM 197198]
MSSEKELGCNDEYEVHNEWYCIYRKIRLIKMGNKCLEFMDKKENRNFQVAYQIELLPNNNQKEWEYAIQLDPVTWFDMLYNLSGDLPNTLKAARSYVNSVQRKYKLPAPIEPTMNSIPSKIYCGHHADCKYCPPPESNKKNVWKAPSLKERPSKNHNSNHEEPPVFCVGMAPQQIRFPRYCNWYVEKERIVIGEDGKDGWICVSQQDDVREILICSHPGTYNTYDKNTRPNNHKTNKHLVIDRNLWIWVLGYFMSTYLVENIYYQAKECHGHLHVHIKPEVVIAFKTAGTDAMNRKIGQPNKQYGIQNCIELETHRLLSSEM